MAGTITEVKRHLDGREQSFECAAVHVTDSVAVIHHVLTERLGPYDAGIEARGFFWARRNYNLFRMSSPEGDLLDNRVDVIDSVSISQERIEYRDLLLDIRISPTGDITIEDEDEVAEAAEAGLLGVDELDLIQRTLQTVVREPRRIIREALASLPEGHDTNSM